MRRTEIDAIPRQGDIAFRQRAIEPPRSALLVVDLQKCSYDDVIPSTPEDAYLHARIRDCVIPNGQRLIGACRAARRWGPWR